MSYIGESGNTFIERYPRNPWWKSSHNNYLINHIVKYKEENFSITILEYNVQDLIIRRQIETQYIKDYNTIYPNGYNFIDAHQGNGKLHELTKLKLSETSSKNYTFIDYNGNLHQIRNLKKFCKNNNLSVTGMSNMLNGISKCSQGFALPNTPLERIEIPNRIWMVEDPNGNIYKINNIYQFCKQNNLSPGSFHGIFTGYVKSYHGWKLPGVKLNCYTNVTIQNNDKLISGKSPKDVAMQLACMGICNLNSGISNICALIKGKLKSYKGWVLKGVEKN